MHSTATTHIGTYTGRRQKILQRAIDSINAQKADLVVFTGDLQNKLPTEVKPHMKLLSSIRAKDGVYSVMGNHDYSEYTNRSYTEEYENVELMLYLQEKLNWYTLQNGHNYIRRGRDSIVIAGMENDGEGRFPQRGNIHHALWGVTRDQFVVMLEHPPKVYASIVVILFGIVTAVKLLQPLKAAYSILVTLFGIVTDVTLLHT